MLNKFFVKILLIAAGVRFTLVFILPFLTGDGDRLIDYFINSSTVIKTDFMWIADLVLLFGLILYVLYRVIIFLKNNDLSIVAIAKKISGINFIIFVLIALFLTFILLINKYEDSTVNTGLSTALFLVNILIFILILSVLLYKIVFSNKEKQTENREVSYKATAVSKKPSFWLVLSVLITFLTMLIYGVYILSSW